MSAMQRGWVKARRYDVGRQPIRRVSVADAKAEIARGGRLSPYHGETGSREVWDREGYAMGYLTAKQVQQLHAYRRTCQKCQGEGEVHFNDGTQPRGHFSLIKCQRCGGTGKITITPRRR